MKHTEKRIQYLKTILANTYVIYIKTQNYHWNVTGIYFHTLHQLFENQYTELAGKIDNIAERIRMLDAVSPGTMSEFLALTTLSESMQPLSWQDMISTLVEDHEKQNQLLQTAGQLMVKEDDEVSAGLITELQSMHQAMLWMLRSHLVEL